MLRIASLLTRKPPALEREQVALKFADGSSILVLRVRDPRARRIKLSVDERGARLTLPARASLNAAEHFLQEHRHWLQQQLALHSAHAGEGLHYGITPTLPLRGQELPLRWVSARATRLELIHAGELHFSAPASAGRGALQRALRDFYEAQGRADLGRWLPKYLPDLPRTPRQFSFKRTSSQWGSLAPDGSVSLDLALLLAQPDAFEYVLVHELCHLLHANHSAHFWREVQARCPAWRHQRDYLRSEGRALKGRLRQLLAG
ncbi:MAG: M48 family metallopeptidase [Thermomonas sp.]|uniref:M48 family metallopeptidase n=1 Tax=Thermomonas sp. TaxID=1971895 RepID=UPI001EC427ED|nr:SprT family zinc-dependent metalloprotease [Thermomonas sp.]MBV2209185.1 M48 family metallopeptidase [Thermomonas sp.]